jgi:hypothetical protein
MYTTLWGLQKEKGNGIPYYIRLTKLVAFQGLRAAAYCETA